MNPETQDRYMQPKQYIKSNPTYCHITIRLRNFEKEQEKARIDQVSPCSIILTCTIHFSKGYTEWSPTYMARIG